MLVPLKKSYFKLLNFFSELLINSFFYKTKSTNSRRFKYFCHKFIIKQGRLYIDDECVISWVFPFRLSLFFFVDVSCPFVRLYFGFVLQVHGMMSLFSLLWVCSRFAELRIITTAYGDTEQIRLKY